jgi:hypothetical protein
MRKVGVSDSRRAAESDPAAAAKSQAQRSTSAAVSGRERTGDHDLRASTTRDGPDALLFPTL